MREAEVGRLLPLLGGLPPLALTPPPPPARRRLPTLAALSASESEPRWDPLPMRSAGDNPCRSLWAGERASARGSDRDTRYQTDYTRYEAACVHPVHTLCTVVHITHLRLSE